MTRADFEIYLLGGAILSGLLAIFTFFRARAGKGTIYLCASWVFMALLLLTLRAELGDMPVYVLGFLVVAGLTADTLFRAGRARS